MKCVKDSAEHCFYQCFISVLSGSEVVKWTNEDFSFLLCAMFDFNLGLFSLFCLHMSDMAIHELLGCEGFKQKLHFL